MVRAPGGIEEETDEGSGGGQMDRQKISQSGDDPCAIGRRRLERLVEENAALTAELGAWSQTVRQPTTIIGLIAS
jgi:hypothetical protein